MSDSELSRHFMASTEDTAKQTTAPHQEQTTPLNDYAGVFTLEAAPYA